MLWFRRKEGHRESPRNLTASRSLEGGAALEAALRGALQRSDAIPDAVSGVLRSEVDGLGQLPDGTELGFPGLEGDGVGEKVKEAVEEVLPGGG